MLNEYVLLKFFHILIAILALGTSAGLGILLEFYGDHPTHGAFLLRAIKRLLIFFVIPGYVLMLVSGLWMVNLSWQVRIPWIKTALVLWGLGLALLAISLAALRRQLGLLEKGEASSNSYRRVSLVGRVVGAGSGLVVIAILYLMVVKPAL